MANDLDNKDGNFKKIVLITVLGICLAWGATYFILIGNENKGVIGDMFGSINALFSGLAFGGIILTIWLQRNELALQREELRYTREELKRTADAQEKSETALNRQAENLKISAELTALNTLVNYYAELDARNIKTMNYDRNITNKKLEYLKRIETIVEGKQT